MGNLDIHANFQLPILGEFTRFGDLENSKISKLAWCTALRLLIIMLFSMLISLLVSRDDIF